MKRIDFIIPYIKGPNNGMELMFALRSIEKNFRHDNYRIIIVGYKPDWIKGIIHLPFNRLPEQKNRTFSDQLLKLYAALSELDVSSQFIWTYDDVYFTSFVKLADIKLLKAVAGFDKYPRHLDGSGAGPNWRSTLKRTMETALDNGGSNYNYETHLPRYFSKSRILSLIDKFNLLGQPMMISSLYYNIYYKDKLPLCLFDGNPGIRFLHRSTLDIKILKRELNRHKFSNNDPRTWNALLQKTLLEMFPVKSKYEK